MIKIMSMRCNDFSEGKLWKMVDCNLKDNTRWVESVYCNPGESCCVTFERVMGRLCFESTTILLVPRTVDTTKVLCPGLTCKAFHFICIT